MKSVTIIILIFFISVPSQSSIPSTYYPYVVKKEQAFKTLKKGTLAFVKNYKEGESILLGFREYLGRTQLIGFNNKSNQIVIKQNFYQDFKLGNTGILFLEKFRKAYFLGNSQIFSFDIDTQKITRVKIDSKILGITSNFFCHSQITYNYFHNYLILGCSPEFKSSEGKIYYGRREDRSGFLIRFPLSSKGEIEIKTPEKRDIFHTSRPIEGIPFSGISTGIWNSGGPLAVTQNGDILVTTGNGPSFPREENYGCSILLIDGETFKLKTPQSFYQLDQKGTQECFFLNKDFSSSSPVIFSTKEEGKLKEFALVTGKLGRLIYFQPNYLYPELNLSKDSTYLSHGIVPSHYGEPLVLNNEVEKKIFTIGNIKGVKGRDLVVLTRETKEIYEQNSGISLNLISCFGYMKKEGKDVAGDLLYTGKVRDIPIIASINLSKELFNSTWKNHLLKPWESELVDDNIKWEEGKNQWSPLVKIASAGQFFSQSEIENIKKPVYSYREFLECQLEGDTCLGSKPRKPTSKVKSEGPFLVLEEGESCIPAKKSWLSLNLYKKQLPPLPEQETFMVQAFDWTNEKPLKAWTYQGEEGERSLNTNHLLFNDGFQDIIVTFSKAKDLYFATFLKAKDGKLLQKLEIPDGPHFNKPLAIDGDLYVSTKNYGLIKLTRP